MTARDRIGQRVGEYYLLRELGGGGFGDVYMAEHLRTQQQAAVKVLHSRLAQKEDWREFLNEARTIRLKHPHIVQLFDFGISDDDLPFLVMEYAPNGTLRQRHPKGSRVPLATVIAYVTAFASALQYAHDQHLVHRDVKPENMLLGIDDTLLLSDFGIAAVAHSSHSIHQATAIGGTLSYMAPEQLHGKPRPASDQYALAVVAYEWLTGTRPFQGTQVELISQHTIATPPPLREQVPDLPLEVEQVILTALAKDPKARFASIVAFAVALSEAATSSLPQSRAVPRPTETVPTEDPTREVSNDHPLPDTHARALLSHTIEATPDTPDLITLLPAEHETPASPEGTDIASTSRTLVAESPHLAENVISEGQLPRRTSLRPRSIILLVLALMVIISSISITAISIHLSALHSQATATAFTRSTSTALAIVGKTATVRAKVTATAHAQWTATAQVQATYTAASTLYEQGIAASGVMLGFDAQHSGVNPYERILNANTVPHLVQSWSTQIVETSAPTLANSMIYVGGLNNTFYALDARTGKQKWIFHTGGGDEIPSTPAVVHGIVYFGAYDNNFYALDANTGTQKWVFHASDIIVSAPTVANGVVYFGSEDHNLYALDAGTGAQKWVFQTGGAILFAPVVANDMVYFGSYDTYFYALNANTGAQQWSFSLNGSISSYAVVANGTVYLNSYGPYPNTPLLYALDANSGTQKWTSSTILSVLAVSNGIAYCAGQMGVYALNLSSGAQLWEFPTADPIRDLIVANDVVYATAQPVSGPNNTLYALDARTGTQKWSFSKHTLFFYTPVVANGFLYLGDYVGNLYAFHLNTL